MVSCEPWEVFLVRLVFYLVIFLAVRGVVDTRVEALKEERRCCVCVCVCMCLFVYNASYLNGCLSFYCAHLSFDSYSR